ncbi:MAG: hypothetical protein IJ940_03805, partial [Bacteroidales bacterium]|nr:hypothetical protein [Bacteroidales bacterium]
LRTSLSLRLRLEPYSIKVKTNILRLTHGLFPESRICTMLLKPDAYRKDIRLDYVAMDIPNDFIVGFGLDYDELGRNLKDIYVLDE